MNERIQELYQKAIQSTMDYHKENPKTKQKELDNFCAFEFSKSIIRECADIASINQHQYNAVGEYVLKHFGIKETKREQIDKAMRETFKNGVDLSGRDTP
jgi:5'-3' exonuclease